jgi:hypothetical protein
MKLLILGRGEEIKSNSQIYCYSKAAAEAAGGEAVTHFQFMKKFIESISTFGK